MPLKNRLQRNTEAGVWFGELPVQSRYTAGVAAEKFFTAIRDSGQFLGARCAACDEVYVPPKLYCEKCFAELKDSDWIKLGPAGTLESWTVVHIGIDGANLPTPDLVGLVRLDGATTALVHRLGDVNPDRLRIGMKVKAVMKPERKREGAITDVLYFRPA